MGVESAWHALKSKTGGSTNLRPSWASTKSWTAGTTLSGLHSCIPSWTAKLPNAKACPGHANHMPCCHGRELCNSKRHVVLHDTVHSHVQCAFRCCTLWQMCFMVSHDEFQGQKCRRAGCGAAVPDAAQDEQLLEGRQEVQAVGQLHLVGLRAVVERPPLLGPTQERLRQALCMPTPASAPDFGTTPFVVLSHCCVFALWPAVQQEALPHLFTAA